ncbi:FAD-dependent thymidylate synthase [Alkaliphilus peptidifermentans]|uniref:Flavin-dependent thymidylate synthase n=1 Tax=Alkaliphilus peptidifermentans DSM 18978 TaxID=1120976 RepID=A0A1G5LA72_9FIRM|nr:FAD-dependent thymidylate synthase [Alkaliphilus peptidifermentans]SCZ09785.1 thymidylate synthase (FAD) [Alkaliphilus peptidifermentans DSM 18978]
METKCKATLITFTPEPEKIIASAAKLCYSSSDIKSLMNKLDEVEVKRFIDMLARLGHESPFEHINFTFGIEGVSRSLTHQLVRHRVGSSYSQKSQRYVTEGAFEYVVPPEIKKISKAHKIYVETMELQQQAYDQLAQLLFDAHYETLIKEGKTEKQAKNMAEKMAIEDARFVLPNACETKIVVTMNARALFNFFHHRCCNRAQWEIRELATQMLMLVREAAPTVFKYSGPNCVSGPCPEGGMTCGYINEVRKKFKV